MEPRRRVLLAVLVGSLVVVAGVATYAVLMGPVPPPSVPTVPPTLPPGTPPPSNGICASPTGLVDSPWIGYHGDRNRSGYVPWTYPSHAYPLWSAPPKLDGAVYAEPLACLGYVFVATENNTVYALNSSGGLVWKTHLGPPVPGSALPCGDIDPSGITGTPVIDPSTGALYVVAYLAPARAPVHHVLFGLDVRTGAVASAVAADPRGMNVTAQQQRGALALEGGVVYVPYGGLDGDCANYHGWVVGLPESGAPLYSYQVPTHREGGIWSAAGISLAPNGTLLVATGNGDSTSTFDFGDSVIALSPQLSVEGYFAPSNWAGLNRNDTDIGSVAPTVLPDGNVFQIGKAGVGYLLNGANLGGIGGQLADLPICAGAYGGTARVGGDVLVPCTDGVFDVNTTATGLSVLWHSGGFDAGSPIVTGNLVWVVDESNATLLGLNLSSGGLLFAFHLGSVEHFISPTVDGGAVVVAAGDVIEAFGVASA